MLATGRAEIRELGPQLDEVPEGCDALRAMARWIESEVYPRWTGPPYSTLVRRLSSERYVYLFVERYHDLKVVVKVFDNVACAGRAAEVAAREFFNLLLLCREFGLGRGRYRVAVPLGLERDIPALATEWVPGAELDTFIAAACNSGIREPLFTALSDVAGLLGRLHNVTSAKRPASWQAGLDYLSRLREHLGRWPPAVQHLPSVEELGRLWDSKFRQLPRCPSVMIHGDATPRNLIIDGSSATAVDLEKASWGDSCWDLGYVAAELKHHFMWRAGDGWAAEPYITHFLHEYVLRSGLFPDVGSVSASLPFYMGLGLLRIARNTWLGETYRERLIVEAQNCLKFGL